MEFSADGLWLKPPHAGLPRVIDDEFRLHLEYFLDCRAGKAMGSFDLGDGLAPKHQQEGVAVRARQVQVMKDGDNRKASRQPLADKPQHAMLAADVEVR